MIGRISARYALRSLTRHKRRTIISMIGVGVGVGIGLFAISWAKGAYEMQVRAASEGGVGHLRIVPATWAKTHENMLRLADAEGALAAAKAIPGVKHVVPRARTTGMLAMGNRSAGVEIVGVLPEAEFASNRIVGKAKMQGRYLKKGERGAIVIGKALAKKLDVELDDELHVMLSGRKRVHQEMFIIVGLVETGSRQLDEALCHISLQDLTEKTEAEGVAEITILLDDYKRIDEARELLGAKLSGGDEALPWQQINTELAANAEGDRRFTKLIVLIIVIVVSLGITSAQLTAVLERRREFGVLLALGMKGRQIIGVLLIEGLVFGIGGAIVSLAVGGPLVYWIHQGIDFSKIMDDPSFAGVLFDPVIHGDVGMWIPVFAFGVSMAATLAASIYPARFALKTNPADALRMV
jgi:ABC-type lipoprotein release transport system permease subunit